MENLTLSSFTGIQKEGQRPAFKYIRYSHLLFSFPWRRSEGKLENPGALARCRGDLIRKFMHKNSREGLYWHRTKVVKETFEIAQLLFWRFHWSHLFEMKTAIASSKLPRENSTKQKYHSPSKKRFFFFANHPFLSKAAPPRAESCTYS